MFFFSSSSFSLVLLWSHFSQQHGYSHVELLINSPAPLSLSPSTDPPSVKCKNFTEKYGVEGIAFPCYYSRKNKTVVMTSFSRETQINTIIHFFVVPFIVTILSSIGICMIHCSCSCKKERPKYRRPRVDNIRWVKGCSDFFDDVEKLKFFADLFCEYNKQL